MTKHVFLNPPLNEFLFEICFFMKYRFIVLKSHITNHTNWTKKKNIEKSARGPINEEKTVNIWRFGHFRGFLTHFPLYLGPISFFSIFSFWFSSCDLCGRFEYNKPRFHDNFFLNKNSFKVGFKKHVLLFQQKTKDFWNIFFCKSVLFLCITFNSGWTFQIFNFFWISTHPIQHPSVTIMILQLPSEPSNYL